jgi:O-antigen/teichoic acid export membrane protein
VSDRRGDDEQDAPHVAAVAAVAPGRGLLRRLLGESAIYGLGGVANQALAIILVPIYARALGVEAYGTVAILTTTLSLTNLVVTLALPQAFFRSYLKEAETDRDRRATLRTTLGLRVIVSVVALAIFAAITLPLSVLLFGTPEEWPLIALIGPIVALDTLNLVPLSLLRAERRPRAYASISFSRAVLGSILIIVFVVGFGLGPFGVVLGSLSSAIVTTSAGIGLLAREGQLRMSLDRGLVRHMLTFSLPLVPGSVAGWTLNLSDRYVIVAVAGRDSVGLYSAGYTVGLAINALAIAPFTLAWGAAYWEISRQADARATVARVLTGFTALAAFVALGLAVLGTDAIRILLGHEFEAGRFVTPFSAFAYVLYGIFTIVTTGLNLESRTGRVPFIMGTAALTNLLLNLLLVPLVGFMGAAVSTVVSYALLALLGGIVSQRFYAVPWDIARVSLLLGLGGALAAIGLLGPDHVLWRIGCVAVYPIVVVGLGLVPRRLLEPAIRLLRP